MNYFFKYFLLIATFLLFTGTSDAQQKQRKKPITSVSKKTFVDSVVSGVSGRPGPIFL
jgi:hypothetical protein